MNGHKGQEPGGIDFDILKAVLADSAARSASNGWGHGQDDASPSGDADRPSVSDVLGINASSHQPLVLPREELERMLAAAVAERDSLREEVARLSARVTAERKQESALFDMLDRRLMGAMADVETYRAENDRLRAELEFARTPWYRRLFR